VTQNCRNSGTNACKSFSSSSRYFDYRGILHTSWVRVSVERKQTFSPYFCSWCSPLNKDRIGHWLSAPTSLFSMEMRFEIPLSGGATGLKSLRTANRGSITISVRTVDIRLPNTAPDGFKIAFSDGYTSRLPRHAALSLAGRAWLRGAAEIGLRCPFETSWRAGAGHRCRRFPLCQ
jgi:hypothetical protein